MIIEAKNGFIIRKHSDPNFEAETIYLGSNDNKEDYYEDFIEKTENKEDRV
jgi:disulfide oxidoreductase YuzD